MFLGLEGRAIVFDERCYLATVEAPEAVVGCALCTPPYGLNISRADDPALDALADDVASRFDALPSVVGPEPAVSDFAARWARKKGTISRPFMRMRLFEARDVQLPTVPPQGALRPAQESDLPILIPWVVAFHQEARTGDPLNHQQVAREDVAGGRLYVWDAGGPLSLVRVAGRTGRSARIGLAYTPPELRGRGYASALVAGVTRRLLDEGLAFCCINTDLENATTNRIYPRIGYRPVCDIANIELKGSPQ